MRLRPHRLNAPPPAPVTHSDPANPWPQLDAAVRRWLLRHAAPAAVDDLTQETMLRLVRRHSHTGAPRNAEAFAITVARSVLIDDARMRQRSPVASTDPQLLAELVTVAPDPTDASDDDVTRRLARCAQPLLAELPAQQRDALLTAADGQVSQSAAATAAGISTPGMKSRVQRGRRSVRGMIERCCIVELDGRGRPLSLTPRTASGCRCGCA